MTDNEIIKALECCFVESDCTECPLHKKYEKDCLKEAATKALDLINRQKAESDHLRQMLEAAIAGQETLQQYFLTPDKPDGIMIRYNEKTGKWDKYEPYMTIECPEEKDYEFIETAIAKQIFKKPLKESLADYGCPTCGAYINFDGLNGNVEHAPKYCSECGQRLDWREDNEYKPD